MCRIGLADVDAKTGMVQIRHGKGEKGRYVFMGPRTCKAVIRYTMGRTHAPGAALWLTERGTGLTLHGLRQILKRIDKLAGVEHCHPHTFRRAFALWSLSAGDEYLSQCTRRKWVRRQACG